MRLGVLVRVALVSLRRNAGRSALTMLGVVIGVAAVVVMVAIGQGAQSQIEARIGSLGTNLIIVTPGAARRTGVSGGAGSQDSLTLEDAVAIRRDTFAVAGVSPVVMTFSMAVVGSANWRTSIHGVDVDWFDIRAWEVASGRPIDETDVRGARKVVLLGATIQEALFGDTDPVGQKIRLRNVPLEVIGVLAKKGQNADGMDQDDVVVVPFTTVRARMAGRQFLGQILVKAASAGEVAEAMTEVRAILRETHRLGGKAEDDFTIKDQAALAEAASETTDVMTTLLLVVASVSLLVGGIGIMNIMLVSVTERTREIGIRRAIGARRGDVLSQFLVEAIVLSGTGGLVGAALGVGVAAVVGRATGWSTPVTPSSIGIAMAFSVGVGVFFGWTPARRAAALDPIEALRQ